MNKELIVISAIWCPSCLILNKNLKKINSEHPEITITKYDYDLNESEVKKYNVGDILPVIVCYDLNHEEKRLIGEKSYDEIIAFLKECGLI